MIIIYDRNLVLIFVLSICTYMYKLNCGCCGDNRYTHKLEVNKPIIKVTPYYIILDGLYLTKLKNEVEQKCIVNEEYIDNTSIYECNDVNFETNYKIEIEEEIKNKPYIIAIVEVQNKEYEEVKRYIVSCLNYKRETGVDGLFDQCNSIVNIKILESENVTDMFGMFYGCSSLTNLDISKFNTENVVNMYAMFYRCSSLKELNLSSFNTSNVKYMDDMFYECSSLKKLDLSSFNTSNVTYMSCMFFGCTLLEELNISNFNIRNVRDEIANIFDGCVSLEKDNVKIKNKIIKDILTKNLPLKSSYDSKI